MAGLPGAAPPRDTRPRSSAERLLSGERKASERRTYAASGQDAPDPWPPWAGGAGS